jgi:hypothetical protein
VLNSQNGHNIEHLVTTRACKAQTASGDMIPRAPPSMASCALSMAAPLHAQAEAESGLGAKQELRLGAEQEREPGQEHEQGVVAAAAPPPAATAMRSGMGPRPAAARTWRWRLGAGRRRRQRRRGPGRGVRGGGRPLWIRPLIAPQRQGWSRRPVEAEGATGRGRRG